MKKFKILMGFIVLCSMLAACSDGQKRVENDKEGIVVVQSDYPYYETAADICGKADLAVKVSLVKSEQDVVVDFSLDETPYQLPTTLYTFAIKEVLKGSYSSDKISLPIVGGKMDGKVYQINDAEIAFTKDGEYLLLLKTFDNAYPSLLNDAQSVYGFEDRKTSSKENRRNGEVSNAITLEEILNQLEN